MTRLHERSHNPHRESENQHQGVCNKGTLIGQMYGTLTGIGWNRWQCDSDRCDLKTLCGYRPAANGYELAGIENGKSQNIDGVPFKAIRKMC